MELWHVLNRGVDKREIVLDDHDRARFIHDLYAFNDANPVQHISQPARLSLDFSYERTLLVHIHAFCLMGNHYHLLISEAIENGISIFLKKLNMGYAKYFNEKYDRAGALWQGRTKKILIEREAHLLYLPYYIHLNPLDFTMPEWRNGAVMKGEAALRALTEYRWSSHLDYLGIRNFPSIITPSLVGGLLKTKKHYEKEIRSIIADPTRATDSFFIE